MYIMGICERIPTYGNKIRLQEGKIKKFYASTVTLFLKYVIAYAHKVKYTTEVLPNITCITLHFKQILI